MASIRYNAFLCKEKKNSLATYKIVAFKHYKPSIAEKKQGENLKAALKFGSIEDALLITHYQSDEMASYFGVNKENYIEIE